MVAALVTIIAIWTATVPITCRRAFTLVVHPFIPLRAIIAMVAFLARAGVIVGVGVIAAANTVCGKWPATASTAYGMALALLSTVIVTIAHVPIVVSTLGLVSLHRAGFVGILIVGVVYRFTIVSVVRLKTWG